MSTSSHLSWKSPDPEAALRAALANVGVRLQELASQQWDPKTSTIGGIRDINLCCLASVPNGWSFLLLHLYSQLADPLAVELSRSAPGPVVAFYEYDQCAWGFSVYEKGERVARFWNRPEVVEEDPQECLVRPNFVARLFGVPVETVAPYLQHLDEDADDADKAFESDEHALGDHWVRCDFMRRLGLPYPEFGGSGTRHVLIKEPGVN
jgi:hypothetical protein